MTCQPLDACHTTGTCDPATGTCSNPNATDGTACTGADKCQQYTCSAGSCAGKPIACQPLDACHTAGACDSATGQCSNPVIPNCDASPTTGDNPFETRAAIIGRVQTFAGAAVGGYTLTVTDLPANTPRSDASVKTAGDGSFWVRLTSFPDSEPDHSPPHHMLVTIDAPGYLRIVRDLFAHPGSAQSLGTITVAARDPNTKTIDSLGGSVTDSQGLITVTFPPGALATPTPVTVTPIIHREEMPAPLPDITVTGYGFELEPTGTQLAAAATVRINNWRNLPTNVAIPVGFFDPTSGVWLDEGNAGWDGSAWATSITHMSTHDLNPSFFGKLVLWVTRLLGLNGGQHKCGIGSSVGLTSGDVDQSIVLPSYQHRGRDYTLTLNYNSGLAGSRTLGTAPTVSVQSVPAATVAVSTGSFSIKAACVPNSAAGGGAGGCNTGQSCALGGAMVAAIGGTTGFGTTTATVPAGADSADVGTWENLPLSSDGTTPIATGFSVLPLAVTLQGASGGVSACIGSGGSFGSTAAGGTGQLTSVSPSPVQIQRPVLIHHRHNSPLGPGWGVEEIARVYKEPFSEHAVLVAGDGSEEDFRLRPVFSQIGSHNGPDSVVFARDPVTGQILSVDNSTAVILINPDHTTTPLYSAVAFTGDPHSMAVTYVGGERRLLIATTTELVQVHPGASVDVLYTRGGNDVGSFVPSQVAARNDLAIYTEGRINTPVLYRFRLSTPAGGIEKISVAVATGGEKSLAPPTGTVLGNYRFFGPAGLAYTPSGQLYVADVARSAVYRVEPDAGGEIGPNSPIARIVGDGGGLYLTELGSVLPAPKFPINGPYYLSTAPDGTLLMGTSYGVAAYDPLSQEAEWLVFDPGTGHSDVPICYLTALHPGFCGARYDNLLAAGPRSFWVAPQSAPMLVDVSQLASERDPTRTMTYSAGQALLVDTTQDLVDSFDVQGRLVQRNRRTGEPLFALVYADATSDRIQTITDPEGNATAFSYDGGGRLQSIQDPMGRQTQLGHDGFGDLTTLTQPDGEVMTFTYEGHHMKTKTVRGLDVTKYEYNTDGTLHAATKPAGEVSTVVASLSQPPQYVNGILTHSATYADAHGVSHVLVIDPMGQVQKDSYTADGVTYTDSAIYYQGGYFGADLEPTATDVVPRYNTLYRVAARTLNGVPTDLSRSFDSLGRVVALSNSGGLHGGNTVVYFSYDDRGFLSDVSYGSSNIDQLITRDSAGHITRVLDHGHLGASDGREVDFTWRSDGQPASVVQHGVTRTLSYDDGSPGGTFNLTGVTDSLGRTASLGYDARGNLGIMSDSTTSESFAYDDNNRLLVAADALGNQTQFGYKQVSCGCTVSDRVASIHTPDLAVGKQWSLDYSAEGRLATITDPDGFPEAYGYEPTGELSSIVDRNGNQTKMTHDHLGRALTMLDALGRTHARTYPVPVATPNITGQPGVWQGPAVMSGSASGAAASPDLAASLNPGDYQIGYNLYPIRGYPPAISLYRDATFDMSYKLDWDPAGRLTAMNDRTGLPSSSSETLNYHSNFFSSLYGYSTNSTEPVLTAQETPRIASLSGPASYWASLFSYNAEFDLTQTSGYGSPYYGQLQTTYVYTRDVGGRLNGVHIGSGPPSAAADQSYSYVSGNDRLAHYSGPDGDKTFTYDPRGLPKSVTIPVTLSRGAGMSQSSTETWTFDYDALGRSSHVTYPDGHVREQIYDNEGRIASRCYKYANANYCYAAQYDAAGNPVQMTDPYGGTEVYAYDALNRLTKVTRSVAGTTEHVESYTYNALGALHTNFDPVAMSTITLDDQRPKLGGGGNADAAIPNSTGGQPVTLDGGGRVTVLSGANLVHDFLGRVTQTVGGTTNTYHYDSFGRIVARTDDGTPTPSTSQAYVLDGADTVATLDATGRVQDTYLFNGIDHPLRLNHTVEWGCAPPPATCSKPSQLIPFVVQYFYEVDLAGNVRRLRDANGADIGGYRYTAFGIAFPSDAQTPAPTIDQPLRWKGRPFVNVAGGLYDVRARWWSPQMGAFLSIDEYAYHDVNSTLWGWGGQNPVKWSDPSGNCPQCILAAAGAIGGGLIAGGYYAFTAPTSLSWGQFISGAANAIGEGAIGGAAGALTAGFAAEAAPVLAPSLFGAGAVTAEQELENAAENGGLTSSEQSSLASFQRLLDEHIQKLEDYLKNPDAYDNQGFLKNATSDEIRQRIIEGRTHHLLSEIENFQNQIDALKDKACK